MLIFDWKINFGNSSGTSVRCPLLRRNHITVKMVLLAPEKPLYSVSQEQQEKISRLEKEHEDARSDIKVKLFNLFSQTH